MKQGFSKVRVNKEVDKVKNHLQKLAPKIPYIDVRIKYLKSGETKTQIFAAIPNRKMAVATKVDESPFKALEKAHKAILRQVHKTTAANKLQRKPVKEFEYQLAA